MPIYEFQCDTCDNTFEKLVFRSDEENFDCPKCGGKKVSRLLSATSFMSGSGLGACSPKASSGFS
jgi:putative FmdB family regulatory protein